MGSPRATSILAPIVMSSRSSTETPTRIGMNFSSCHKPLPRSVPRTPSPRARIASRPSSASTRAKPYRFTTTTRVTETRPAERSSGPQPRAEGQKCASSAPPVKMFE